MTVPDRDVRALHGRSPGRKPILNDRTDMTKRTLFFLSLLLAAACSHHKIIPDDKLAMIFRDAFLANAYVGEQGIRTDSLRIYEPIFERYGYSAEDVEYTVGNFSKRKSARLSDVVEAAIGMLDAEGTYYEREVAVLDTIANASRRALMRTIYADSLLTMKRLKDSSRLCITLDSIRAGEYRVSARYLVDSLDRNRGLRGGVWTELPDGSRRNVYTFYMRRGTEETFTRNLTADTSMRRLVVNLANFTRERKRPSVTIRDLKIEYTPPAEAAVDSFYLRQLDIRIFAEEFFRHAEPKDSL